jgi:uncharacterized membrane protein YozB (DUF420 family)
MDKLIIWIIAIVIVVVIAVKAVIPNVTRIDGLGEQANSVDHGVPAIVTGVDSLLP